MIKATEIYTRNGTMTTQGVFDTLEEAIAYWRHSLALPSRYRMILLTEDDKIEAIIIGKESKDGYMNYVVTYRNGLSEII